MRSEGREPRDPPSGRDPFAPKPTDQRNFTDPDSKIMKSSDGAFHQSYNGQAVVDSDFQVIVAAELSNHAPDSRELEPALEQLAENLEAIGGELAQGAVLAADAGYWNSPHIEALEARGIKVLCPPDADTRKAPTKIRSGPRYERMRERLKEPDNEAAYRRRQQMIEPIFAQIKVGQRAGRFSRRGLAACRAEWRLITATHNLLKLYRANLGLQGA